MMNEKHFSCYKEDAWNLLLNLKSLHNCVIKLHDNVRQSYIYDYLLKSFESFCHMKFLDNVRQY